MEQATQNVYYRALQSRDARFDGLIFVGIATTGVYCRPICPARTPKIQNCNFYPSAAAAQEAGFRPCLRCRPEIAPGLPSWSGTSTTVARALSLIAEGALDGSENNVEKLATRLGIGERQLRRLFLQHLGASPISVAQTRRILFAKQLIHDTHMPMSQVAAAAGFNSLRRFNETFLSLYQRPPRDIRRQSVPDQQEEDVTLRLHYRAPYNWPSMLDFLRARAITGVELVEDKRYLRTIEINNTLGSIAVTHQPKRSCLSISIRFPDVKALPLIVDRIRRLFDLTADIVTIDKHLSADKLLAPLIKQHPGLRAPGGWDGFEIAVRAVLGQQISISAARNLAGKIAATHGRTVPASLRLHPALTHTFPSAKKLATSAMHIGMPTARLNTLRAIAQDAVADPNLFRASGNINETINRLKSIRGIGDWSAQYIALRAVREMDAFPVTDLGILRGAASLDAKLSNPKTLLTRAEAWRPWRAYAAQHLWAANATTNPPSKATKGKGRSK